MSNLNPVETTITIAGKPCHFVHLTLKQAFNKHSYFEIKVDYEELDSLWMANPIKMIQLIGESVNISMKHKITGENNLFAGIITNVSMAGKHGEQNYIMVSGSSPTIKLDGEPMMNSFVDLTLDAIVNEAVGQYGNGGEVTAKSKYTGKIDYICQNDESVFQFLNRLSWLYGEWFFFDGSTCYFGNPNLDDTVELTYDKEITHFNLSANLISPNVNRIEYLNHDNNEVNSDTPPTVPGVRGYIKASLDRSEFVYKAKVSRRLESSILTKKELDDLVKVDKSRRVSQMLIMSGNTQTCKVRIGKLIKVKLPEKMRVPLKVVETFRVTEVTHDIDQDGTYQNSFSAIPSEIENIPMDPVKAPVALPQIAWVKTNADEKGRVKVETQWQKAMNKTTNWIRVQTPDSGSSGKVAFNRGFVFIPEEGDLVMLNFEGGDPNRPYVSGSIFTENVSKGGGNSNKSKSLTTRTGSTVTLDDSKGSLTIKDKHGSDSIMIMDGEQNIIIASDNTIMLSCGKSNISMDKDGNISITGTEIFIGGTTSVNIASGPLTEGSNNSGISLDPKEIGVSGVETLSTTAGETIYIGAEGVFEAFDMKGKIITINGTKVNIN